MYQSVGSLISSKCSSLEVRQSHTTHNYDKIFSQDCWSTYLWLYHKEWKPISEVQRPHQTRPYYMCPEDLILDFGVEGEPGEISINNIHVLNGQYLIVDTNNTYPSEEDMFKSLAYIKHFQDLDSDHKLKILNGEIDISGAAVEFLQTQVEQGIQRAFKQRIESRLRDITRQINNHKDEINDLYRQRIFVQHQEAGTTNIISDVKALQRLQEIERIEVEGSRIYIYTKPLVVRYYDQAIYEKYKVSYYNGHTHLTEVMDHVMAGRGNIYSGHFRLSISLDSIRLDISWDELGNFSHPHRSCRGQFENPMVEAQNEFRLYDLVTLYLQWFQSLNFDDSVVAQDWLRRYTGVQVGEEVFNLRTASDRGKALRRMNKLIPQEVTTNEPNDIA